MALAAGAPSTRLKRGKSVQAVITAGQTQTYTIKLNPNQYSFTSVAPPDPAVIIEVDDPGGRKVAEVDTRSAAGERGRIQWIGETKGEYRINIRLADQAQAGRYTLRMEQVHAARTEDRSRLNAEDLFRQGLSQARDNNFDQAISTYAQALDLYRQLKDREREADTLLATGDAYEYAGQDDKAVGYYEQTLQIERELQDQARIAIAINALGNGYFGLSQYEKAIAYYGQALEAFRQIKDRRREAAALGNLGNSYGELSQFQKAIVYHEQALAVFRELKNRRGEAFTLGNLGIEYADLSQFEKAVGYYEQALPVYREIQDSGAEGRALANLGDAYVGLGQYEKAIGYQEQALVRNREAKDRFTEGHTLSGIGTSYLDLKNYEKAAGYYEQALAIAREVMDRSAEGADLNNLAEAYRDLAQYDRAAGYYVQALAISREVKDRRVEAAELTGLMETSRLAGRPRLAIFYGKQAVNTVQAMRSDIGGLSQDLQQSFLKGNEEPYHILAELLIAQGRLAEAEQVLALLKEEEYFEYIRGDSGPGLERRADLTPEEAEYEKRYREIGDHLMAIGRERGDLLAKKSMTPQESERLMQLEQDLTVSNEAFERFLGDLTQHFSAKPELNARVVDQLREEQGFMEDLRELPPGTVAIYTLAGQDEFHVILRTPDAQKAYEYPIKAADLNRKIFDFREAVGDPKADPRPLGQELYKILMAPMAEDLRQAKAQTLMWSLDGTLRYVPIAALYDGEHYLVEQYRVSVMTLASNARLKDLPDRAWSEAGFGVTKQHEDNAPLPEVAAELDGVQEILHGEIKLDEQFTESSMRATLLKHFPVVHIASHFRFMPGDQSKSFLLLGDGAHLSLEQIKTLPNLFSGVQLLTLSACNTGVGDGTEVEGFGTLAQRQGAKAVIASLWPVADTSTSRLMQEFYRLRESTPGMTKLEALREAQLELLRGKAESASYSHPFYWAPFFLMGNWL